MKRAHARLLRQRDDLRARIAIVAAHQHVAIDRLIELSQQLRRDILKCRHDAHPRPQHRLRLDDSGAAVRQLHAAHLRRHERHGDVDQDFPGERRPDLLERRKLCGIGHRQDHDVPVLGRGEIVGAFRAFDADAGVDGGRRLLRALAHPRADDDMVAGIGPAERQAAALLAGAAEHGNLRLGLRLHGDQPATAARGRPARL